MSSPGSPERSSGSSRSRSDPSTSSSEPEIAPSSSARTGVERRRFFGLCSGASSWPPANAGSVPASSPGSSSRGARSSSSANRSADRFAASAGLPVADARTLLAKFGLGAEELSRPARSLSPGERTRASLAALAARGVNLLLLDEPTNHLDLEAIEELEAALEGFRGTIVLVSHDRRLLKGFRATRTFEVRAGRVWDRS